MIKGLALTGEGLSRLTRARVVWPVVGIGVGVAVVWLNFLSIDATNARAAANAWDLVLMLQNNGFVLVFVLLIPFSLAVGRLLHEDDAMGYKSAVCLRLGQRAGWVYPTSMAAVMLCTAVCWAIVEGGAWVAVGWVALGHLGPTWSAFATSHSVYWLVPPKVLLTSPVRAVLFSLLSNSWAMFAVTCLAAGVGQWINAAYGTVATAVLMGVLSLWISHGTTGLLWSPIASGLWMLHGPAPLTPSLPPDWSWIYLSGLALAGTGLMVIRHVTLETWS